MNSVSVWLSSFSHVEEFGSSAFTASTHSGSAPAKNPLSALKSNYSCDIWVLVLYFVLRCSLIK